MTSVQHVSVVSVSLPPRSFHNCIIVSQLHPSPISPYPRLKMCISTQSRSHLNPIQVSRFVSDLHPGSQIHVSSLSQLNLTSIWVLIFASRLHPCSISPPSRSTKLHLSSIQASSQTHTSFKMCVSPPSRPFLNWRIVSQLHPSPISPYPRLKMCISTQSRSHLNPIQVSRFVFDLHPGSQIHVSSLSQLNLTSIWLLIFPSRLHPGNTLPPSRSTKLHLSSVQASSLTHTGFTMCVSPPSKPFLNWRIASQLHPSPISPHPRLKMCISAQSRSHLNPIQVSRFVFHLHPGSQIHGFSLSQLNLISIWVLIFASRLHPGNISPPSSSTKLHLSSIQASSQIHTGFKMCVSAPYRSFLNWRIVSQLHPSPISPYPRLKMCISTQSRPHLNPIQVL